MRVNDFISGLALIAAAALMFALTLTFPPFPGQKYGPSLFPRILASAIILCGLILVWRGIGARRGGERWIAFAGWTRDPWRLVSFLLVIGLTFAYVLVSEWIGFLPVAFVLLAALFLWFRTRPWVALTVAAAATWVIHYFFASLMRVPLPRGLLTNIL